MKLDLFASKEYEPTAIYYEDSDSLEYLRVAVPTIYRRIDEHLSLILSMKDRTLVGFKVKGFKNFYLRSIKPKYRESCPEFVELVELIQELTEKMGGNFFEKRQKEAYLSALEMAAQDKVHVRDFPITASN